MTEPATFSPEDQLVLLLARGSLSAEIRARAADLLARRLDWPMILDQPQYYRIFPLLYRHLQTLGFAGVPDQARNQLETVIREVAATNAFAARGLIELLRLFDQAGIPAIPLKGMALAESLYGDLTLRVSDDIDILIPRASAGRAIELIATLGYRAESAQWSIGRLLTSFIEYPFVREGSAYAHDLDLHWGVLWWRPLDKGAVEDLWMEARSTTVLGVRAYAMSPEWEFLFLAAHAARDAWLGLKWLADIQQACARGGIDWDRVWEKAERFEWQEVLELTASVCNYLVGPPPFAKGPVREIPSWLKPYIQMQHPPARVIPIVHLHLLRHNSERLRYVLHGLLIPTSTDWEFLPLPAYLRFLYYPVRVFRLLIKFASSLISAKKNAQPR
ncbi:MAG TPA: nucleotidyltransferase family protein [Candidatus Binataceae bacterium]|nr:nucleotidyltransferase family protein [Candidatus Binataceae bacterium]